MEQLIVALSTALTALLLAAIAIFLNTDVVLCFIIFFMLKTYCELNLHGMFSRVVGLARNAARNTLTNLVYNVC